VKAVFGWMRHQTEEAYSLSSLRRGIEKKKHSKKKKSTFELTTTVAGARKIAMRIEQAKYTLQLQLSRGLNNCLDSDYVAFFQTT
jgi:hypothetical protein